MATVINKSTFQIIKSVNTPDYDPVEWIIIDRQRDNSDYDDLVSRSVPNEYWKVVDDRLQEMTSLEKEQYDVQHLEQYKEDKINVIEQKTDNILSEGFEFPPGSGLRFSLDIQTRTLILGLIIGKDVLPYPVLFNTIDQKASVTLQNATDVENFYGTALLTVKSVQDSGTALKESVRAAQSKSQLDTIVDNR